jgi:hypothetical protein
LKPEEETLLRLGGPPPPGSALIHEGRGGEIAVTGSHPRLLQTERQIPGTVHLRKLDHLEQWSPKPWSQLQATGWRYLEPASRYLLTKHGWSRRCHPFEVQIEPTGILLGTLGNATIEMAAATIVAYHIENSLTEWSGIPKLAFIDWAKNSSRITRWSNNPVWRPNFAGLCKDDRLLSGWTPETEDTEDTGALAHVTSIFIECLATPRVGGFPVIKRVML